MPREREEFVPKDANDQSRQNAPVGRDLKELVPYCPKCGYNLTGLNEHRCPECGTIFDPNALLQHQLDRNTLEIVLISIVLGTFFALLAFGMMVLGHWATVEPQQTKTCGVMCFDEDRLAFLLGIVVALEGAVGGFFASLVLLSGLQRKPLGRVVSLTFLIHSIPISAFGFLLGITDYGGICGVGAFIGGSFAITCALVARRTPDRVG